MGRSFCETATKPNPGRSFPHWRASMGQILAAGPCFLSCKCGLLLTAGVRHGFSRCRRAASGCQCPGGARAFATRLGESVWSRCPFRPVYLWNVPPNQPALAAAAGCGPGSPRRVTAGATRGRPAPCAPPPRAATLQTFSLCITKSWGYSFPVDNPMFVCMTRL